MNDNVLPVPADAVRTLDEPLLLCSFRGVIEVVVDDAVHRIERGRALWIPRASRVEFRLRVDDVALPVSGVGCGDATRPMAVEIPPAWEPWLLHAFGEALDYLDGESSRLLLGGLLARAMPAAEDTLRPAPPSSADLRALASAFEEMPARAVAEIVGERMPGWGIRTLQRQFVQETGLTPAEWARRRRLDLAAGMLASGDDLEAVAHRIGYTTVGGFSRAFAAFFGATPGRWRDSHDRRERVPLRPAPPHAGEELPAHRTWLRANGAHVAVWVARGSAELTIGTRTWTLSRGEGLVIPAGAPNSIRLPRGALLLPVGYRSGRSGPVALPLEPAVIGRDDELSVIREMVSAYTSVRRPGADALSGFMRILTGSRTPAAREDDVLIAGLASAVSAGEIPEESLASCARWSGRGERDLSRVINDRTGLTFAQWIRVSRMSRARVRLQGGEAPSAVSRGLGYAHLPAFTRAFREVHGATPREVAPATRSA